MKKSYINKHEDQPSTKQQSIPKDVKGSFFQSIKRSTIIVIVILIFIYLLCPRITIIPGKNINPRDPFNTSFIIQNNSIYSVHDIKSECRFDNIEDDNHHIFDRLTANIDTGYIEKLGPRDSRPIIFHITIKGLENGVIHANIRFLLSYKLPLIPLNLSKAIPLTVKKTSENKYQWSASN
jgi:hypothetical protein